jgi:hypothetical protein
VRIQERLHDPQARFRAHGRECVGVSRNLLGRSFAFHRHLYYFDNIGNTKTCQEDFRHLNKGS